MAIVRCLSRGRPAVQGSRLLAIRTHRADRRFHAPIIRQPYCGLVLPPDLDASRSSKKFIPPRAANGKASSISNGKACTALGAVLGTRTIDCPNAGRMCLPPGPTRSVLHLVTGGGRDQQCADRLVPAPVWSRVLANAMAGLGGN